MRLFPLTPINMLLIALTGIGAIINHAISQDLVGVINQDVMRTTLRIPHEASLALARDGCVVLQGVLDAVPPPLRHTWRCSSEGEEQGVEAECRMAAAISCTLLGASALCDPAGCSDECRTSPYEHYDVTGLLDHTSHQVICVLPREPMTLHFAATLPPTGGAGAAAMRLLHERNHFAVFARDDGDGSFGFLKPETIDLDAGDALDIDAGDVVVMSGDHAAFHSPPDGIATAPMIYRFAACDARDVDVLFYSPMVDARLRLQRAHLQRTLELPS